MKCADVCPLSLTLKECVHVHTKRYNTSANRCLESDFDRDFGPHTTRPTGGRDSASEINSRGARAAAATFRSGRARARLKI